MDNSSPSVSRARFTVRLREANLGTERFIDIENGSKVSNDHTQYNPDSPYLDGSYAVYPGRGGNSDGGYLVAIDVDDYNDVDELAISELNALPDTFTVETPHTNGETGGHRFYAVTGDPPAAMKDAVGVRNPVPTFGECRVQNGYVVGPGSELDGCSKEWCDECDSPEGGHYQISADRRIATIPVEELVEVIRDDPNYSASPSEDDDGWEQVTFDD